LELRHKRAEPERSDLCSVSGCNQPFKRTLSYDKVKGALPHLSFKGKEPRRVHLCKDHYKEYKKATKEDRKLERLGWER
jgi:hypothetical protein